MYTSGTTGHPKGVVSSHLAITAAVNMVGVLGVLIETLTKAKMAAAGMAVPDVSPQDCVLLAVPLFHVTATHAVFLPCFFNGRKMVMMCVAAGCCYCCCRDGWCPHDIVCVARLCPGTSGTLQKPCG